MMSTEPWEQNSLSFIRNIDDPARNRIRVVYVPNDPMPFEFAIRVNGEEREAVLIERARAEWLLKMARILDRTESPGAYESFLDDVRTARDLLGDMQDGWLDPLP
jgi:hypothetical protein